MKKYITPEMEVIKMEITDSILANSFIDVGGNGTDHFDAQRKDSPVIWGKSETNKSLWE